MRSGARMNAGSDFYNSINKVSLMFLYLFGYEKAITTSKFKIFENLRLLSGTLCVGKLYLAAWFNQ